MTTDDQDERDEHSVDDDGMSEDDMKTVVAELSDALSRTQRGRDDFVRVIAAGALALTASLIAALEESGWSGGAAIVLAFASLALVLASFWTAERAIRQRIAAAREADWSATEPEKWLWNRMTNRLNQAATGLLVLAGAALAAYVTTHTT